MTPWKKPPENLDAATRQLIDEIRSLKAIHELGTARIAERTGYSKSSWDRYFAGRTIPPESALAGLARLTGTDPSRLLALRQRAVSSRERQHGAPSAGGEPAPSDTTPLTGADGRQRRGSRRRALLVTAAGLGLIGVALGVVLLVLRPWQDSNGSAAPTYTCRVTRTGNAWHAGLSDSDDAVLGQGNAGPDVAEVQCLLQRAGFPPGDTDGLYGPLTERAVKRLQEKAGLVTDGTVGPRTWKALRG
ncbi:peptidoglycan-binding protein [Streptomyces sp. NPDC052000]|uniref:peptidoglycan-binding protein n=1 Tax=Streptomyces sp. NPDC052000 TaxID=3155676 RepID=UPI00344F4759